MRKLQSFGWCADRLHRKNVIFFIIPEQPYDSLWLGRGEPIHQNILMSTWTIFGLVISVVIGLV